MTIIAYVCAEFRNRSGQLIYAIHPSQLQSILEAPEEIQEDPLYRLMTRDGSLKAVHTLAEKKALELDPGKGITAEGKRAPETDPEGGGSPAGKKAGAGKNEPFSGNEAAFPGNLNTPSTNGTGETEAADDALTESAGDGSQKRARKAAK